MSNDIDKDIETFEKFKQWLIKEMPANTIIGNPEWWAKKIYQAFVAALSQPQEAVAWMSSSGSVVGKAYKIRRIEDEMSDSWWKEHFQDYTIPLFIAPPNYEALLKENERLREVLERLARLGNGEHYGNSEGNCIAIEALKKGE